MRNNKHDYYQASYKNLYKNAEYGFFNDSDSVKKRGGRGERECKMNNT